MSFLLKLADRIIATAEDRPFYDTSRAAWAAGGDLFADINKEMVVEEIKAPVEKVSPVEFRLLFTPDERVAIKAVRADDPVIDDFYDIVEDPRLTHVDLGLQSTKDAIGYLQSKQLLTAERAAEILSGKLL